MDHGARIAPYSLWKQHPEFREQSPYNIKTEMPHQHCQTDQNVIKNLQECHRVLGRITECNNIACLVEHLLTTLNKQYDSHTHCEENARRLGFIS